MRLRVHATGGYLCVMNIYTDPSTWRTVYFSGMASYLPGMVMAGDNGGNEMTINLSDVLAGGAPITQIQFQALSTPASPGTLQIDYVIFEDYEE